LPVAEHALPLVARPVPLVWVVVAGLVDGIPAREPGARNSADPGDDLEWAVPAPPVPAAVLARAARERLPRERDVSCSVGPEDDPAWAEPMPSVPAAVSPQAARERLPRERDSGNSVGLEGDPARVQLALLAAVVGLVGGAREGR